MTTMVPTSFAQRRLWFLDRLEPGSSAYNVPVAVRLHGDLDVAALRRALTALVARHEALRTTFREVDGEPMQVIGEPTDVPLPVYETSDVDAAIRREAAGAFDLATGPLLRCALLDTGTDHVLLLTAHHIVIDGWSLGVLFRDLAALYAGEELPELAVQYRDFAVWQRENLAAEALGEDVEYWRNTLAGAPAVLELPTEFPRGKSPSGAGAIATARLSADLTDDLDTLAEAEGVTLYMTLVGAFQVLLSRYTGQPDVVVGTPTAGRPRPELEPLVGCFINTLPLRTDLTGALGFRELLGRIRAATLAGYEHQSLSFEHIVDAVQPDRTVARTPIFQVMFTVDNTPSPGTSGGQLRFEFLPPYRDRVKYDLNITVSRAGDELAIAVEYRTDLFGDTWLDRFLSHYRTLLAAVVDDPERPVTELPLLPAAERNLVLNAWNDTAVEFPSGIPVTTLIRRQMAATPDAVALVCGEQRLTYRELGERANQVAHVLSELGAGRRIGLCLERSVELVAGLLGVLEAGCAYLPLDPGYPAERLAFMAEDAGLDIVLTHGRARDSVPSGVRTVVDLDDLQAPTTPLPRSVGPDDCAYVIYTSGSTGQPKGVANIHRGLVNRLVWTQREFQLDGTDVVLQKTPYSFDVSVWEFLWPLVAGARLVLARPGGHKDPGYLAELIRAENVTTVHFVPSMLQVFLEATDIAQCPSLRRVLCSGEALPAALVRRFHGTGTSAELHNLYGPTEAAIDVSHWRCAPGDPGNTVPIGRPIANTRLYVLDAVGEPTPVGVPGELFIGGVQVATGYVNRPELTAERFVPNPFHGGTMYRTGDLARWRPDGAIEYLGRLDHQVKLRGFRIELGEVETAIRAQDGVRDAVVVARADQLVAYVVGDTDVRERLARVLPEYMVPAVVVPLGEIPLSANGKVDRNSLPEPAGAVPTAVVPARDGLELELVALWEELLAVRPVGVTDDFFDLGGNSLRVIRMLGRIKQRYGHDLPVSVMFSGGATVERLARELRRGDEPRIWSPVVAIRETGDRPPLFCLPPAVGNALSYVDLARHLPADQPVYGLQAIGLDAGQQPERSLEAAAKRYADAIRTVQPGPYRLAGYCVGSVTALAVAHQLLTEGEDVEMLAVLDGGPPNLDNGFEQAYEADIAAWFAWELGRAANRDLVIDPTDLRQGTPVAKTVLAQAIAHDVLPPGTDLEQLARLLATFDASVRAVRDYEPKPFPGRVVAFQAADEPPDTSPVNRWEPLAGAGLSIEKVPGDHYSMMRPPHVEHLAAALDHLLTEETVR
ncbi:non-ribosomal peptide synthetase [Actinocrispum wychmicini]|uniref:Amino acid adenylation domain-containing protein n=1 Tax=Actinocrispum wychmicini TaxID=1213861 RepID=A0A4R2JFC7_9PSEU|nr:amino acid adenylation domain-containing protein [Actinocrispum wychmicini]TCO55606.1 amino acid adenylation domain-containing protein [Actinocrispum wychmicini]